MQSDLMEDVVAGDQDLLPPVLSSLDNTVNRQICSLDVMELGGAVESETPGSKLYHLLAMCSSAAYIILLRFNFHICEMGIKTSTSIRILRRLKETMCVNCLAFN